MLEIKDNLVVALLLHVSNAWRPLGDMTVGMQ